MNHYHDPETCCVCGAQSIARAQTDELGTCGREDCRELVMFGEIDLDGEYYLPRDDDRGAA